MTTPHLNAESAGNRSSSLSGSALIIVLASLIFVSVLTVAFLMSMRSKLALSKSGSNASEVKMLAETTVNIAISQVRDATKKSGANNLAWASQPGMIRLYDDSGAAAGYYKLYSADNMVATSGAFSPASDAVPAAWVDNPAVYTDLNAPANGVFPILNYDAASLLIDPMGTIPADLKGLSLGTVPGSSSSQPAPMPVKWLYILEDGSLHSPDPSSSGTKAVIGAATAANTIIGRVAFWTDDETCKLNVNTASEGTFWSTPRFNTGSTTDPQSTTGDRALARSQPARGEYQRYPGHPATVSLKSVFPTLTSEQIFAIAPRLNWGGSKGGTVPVQDVTTWVATDTDRLYASVDEVLLKTNSANRTVQDGLTKANVEGARFFLTASSRAPELNLFGLPRIATWPIHAVNDTNYRTVNDRLIAFCSTLGTPPTTFPFYFTRDRNLEPTHDIGLTRNIELLDYLDRLTAKPIPGFGGSFQSGSKYGQLETRQILTEIFDYIRCTNLFDRTTPAISGNYPYAFGISSRANKGEPNYWSGSSLGTAVPAYRPDWATRGFGGRFLQIRSAHLHFVGLGDAANPINPAQIGTRDPAIVDNVVPANTVAVQAYIYLSTLTPSEGIEYWSPGHWIVIEGLDQFKINNKPMGFAATGEMCIMGNMLGGGGVVGARVSNLEPFAFTFQQNSLKKLAATDPTDSRSQFPFFSFILPVDSSSGTMEFKGGTINVSIYAEPQWPASAPYATHGSGALIGTFPITFPDATFPTPKLANIRLVGSGGNAANSSERWAASPRQYFESANDVLRSIPLADGDIRQLVGPTPDPAEPFFEAQPDYSDSTKRMVPDASAGGLDFTKNGKLVPGASYFQSYPWVPSHINGVTTSTGAPGDWDNGTSIVADGPFINAADPGSVMPINTGNLPYYDNSNMVASGVSSLFSPNRQIPGPGMFGSLSTGVQRRLPWQTLLFRPGPASHPGAVSPPDHLLLDLFWMPVVEPYAISEPFSTAGKINMNQQLVPFSYINRTAGLRAVLTSEQVAMVSKSNANKYKTVGAGYTSGGLVNSRFPLNLSDTNGTLRQFKDKFDSGEIFRSPTEICDIYLVPDGKTWTSNATAQASSYSDDFAMVGDNTRERPYAHIYNKLTTKSNVFTVHYHAQVLQKSKARNLSDADAKIFDTGAGDKVVAEQRGSTTFERYLDPADPRIVAKDPASATATSFEEFYRARIVNTTVFSP